MRRIVLASLLALASIRCASDRALDVDQTPKSRYTGDVGATPVGVIPEATLRDTARNRDMLMSIDYPIEAGLHPLIIFSHAIGASHRDYIPLTSFWASQGYVVIKPSHVDAGRVSGSRTAQSVMESQTANDWRERVRDITFVIDSLDQLERDYPELQGKIDRAHIGVGGHGYGAFTAMLAGGGRTFPGATTYADPRIQAVVLMSPAGPGPSRGLSNESFAQLNKPTLFMVAEDEPGANETENADWRRQAFALAPAGDKWLVTLQGVGQGAFTGRIDAAMPSIQRSPVVPSGTDPSNGPVINPTPTNTREEPRRPRESVQGMRQRGTAATVKALSLAFWDTYLRANAEGRTALEGAGSRGGVVVEKK
ncbi:MAG: hypothetical protein M3Q69_13390 [Acidobacteriota bacterium]|nr:hypothetical protein [Acidobacteriota bacterium]